MKRPIILLLILSACCWRHGIAFSQDVKPKGTASFLEGIEVISNGRFLDVDTGAVVSTVRRESSIVPEICVKKGKLWFISEPEFSPNMKSLAYWISDAEWHFIKTSAGQMAWIQVLRPEDPAVVRFVTRIRGKEGPLPAPRGLFSVGHGDSIDIHFQMSEGFKVYRIERQDRPGDAFHVLGTIEGPLPYKDTAVKQGRRYTYRISGISSSGAVGLPALLVATPITRGVFSGTIKIPYGQGFDFLTQKLLKKEGDVFFGGTAGGQRSATFMTYLGTPLYAERHRKGPWDLSGVCPGHIAPGKPFSVPLRGGGVARCSWDADAKGVVTLRFEVNPDGYSLDFAPVLTVTREKDHAIVYVACPKGYSASQVTVADTTTGKTRSIEITDGVARDSEIQSGRIRVYSAVGEDSHGRKTPIGKAVLNLFPRGVRKGEFHFHYKQGYSIEQQRLAPLGEADVFFRTCAGGISSVTLSAPKGITNLGFRAFKEFRTRPPAAILASIVSVDPKRLRFSSEADGDDDRSWEDVFILRTRNGGWAKLAIVHRSSHGGWTEQPVVIRYAYNAWEPVFEDTKGSGNVTIGAITYNPKVLKKAEAKFWKLEKGKVGSFLKAMAGIDTKAKILAKGISRTTEKKVQVGAVLGRSFAKAMRRGDSYVASTFSFEHATRDDVRKTRNDWDILFGDGGNTIETCTVSDDRSQIWDMGAVDFEKKYMKSMESGKSAVVAVEGHVYSIYTKDTDSELWVKMKIIDLKPAKSMIFRWEITWNSEKVRNIERVPGQALTVPYVRLQIRAGAGGGNPNRAFMDGTKNMYVDVISKKPLDMTTEPNIDEEIRCFIQGGLIPEGKVWIVESIDVKAQANGDSNGPGEFILQVGPYRIVHLKEDPSIFTIDRGLRQLTPEQRRVKHSIQLEIYLWPGQEKNLFAEVANSSLCDVTIRGRFVDQRNCVKKSSENTWGTGHFVDLLHRLKSEKDAEARAASIRSFAESAGEMRPFFEKMYEWATNDEYRALLKKMLADMK